MRLSVLFIATLLVGCAIPKMREFKAWDNAARQDASAGTLKWSDYYAQRFERLKSGPPLIAVRGVQMQKALSLRDVALKVESGAATHSDLVRAQQQADADIQAALDQEDAAMNAAAASRPPPKQTICRPVGSSVICN